MAHHIYHVKGFIIAQRQKGEADILLKIFTPEFGMVLATAQGARKLESKTRFAISQYSIPEIDLIKTKDSFRVGAVRPEQGQVSQSQKKLRAKIAAILARFVVSEEPHEKLYSDVIKIIEQPHKNSDLLAMVVILSNLGYWHLNEIEKDFISTYEISASDKKTLIKKVQEVLSQIHL